MVGVIAIRRTHYDSRRRRRRSVHDRLRIWRYHAAGERGRENECGSNDRGKFHGAIKAAPRAGILAVLLRGISEQQAPARPDCRRAAYRTRGRVAPLERRTRPARAPVRPLPGYLLGGADGPDGAFFSVGWLGVLPAPAEPLALPLGG